MLRCWYIKNFQDHANIRMFDVVDRLTFKSHVVFNNKLLGFKSLCSTLAECMYLRPRKI